MYARVLTGLQGPDTATQAQYTRVMLTCYRRFPHFYTMFLKGVFPQFCLNKGCVSMVTGPANMQKHTKSDFWTTITLQMVFKYIQTGDELITFTAPFTKSALTLRPIKIKIGPRILCSLIIYSVSFPGLGHSGQNQY